MSCDFNNGAILRAEAKLSSKYSICDNKWHNVSAFYDTHQIAIRIDNKESVVASSSGNAGKLQTKSPLYIGGIPGEDRSSSLP
jgi:laminin alpha 1/2